MGRHKINLSSGPAATLADQRQRFVRCDQIEMARRLGCSQTFVSFVETGKAVPDNIRRWAREYRLSMKRFRSLMDNQFLLPLWRFSERTPAPEVNPEIRTVAV